MSTILRRDIIKNVHADLPRGAPFDLAVLKKHGVSAALAAKYAENGWLVRLGQGVYSFPNDEFDLDDTLKFVQTRVPGLHIAGKTALAMQGVRHNLTSRETVVLWGDARYALPEWFTSRFPARYSNTSMFDWQEKDLDEKTLTTPPGIPSGVKVSAPERAVLEMLYEAGVRQNMEEARNIFEGVRNPRKNLLGKLLSYCTSVKAVRLFLTWARETNMVDVDALLAEFHIETGSDKRWITRLKDGTLLSLKPHG